jgi:hypothetical protein
MAKEGARGQERHHSCFVHLESLERSKEMRMEALGEASLGASFMEGARRLRASFICCVCSCLVEGALEEEGASLQAHVGVRLLQI